MTIRARIILVILFAGSGAGLLMQILTVSTLSHRLLAIAVLLMGIDQARMAIVDLTNVHVLRDSPKITNPSRLEHFYRITLSTIALELVGFYVSTQWLGWGCVIVLLSQLWFNTLANVQLTPAADTVIQDFGISTRAPVLLANCVATIPVILFIFDIFPLVMAIVLFSMVCLYAIVKYGPALSVQLFPRSYLLK